MTALIVRVRRAQLSSRCVSILGYVTWRGIGAVNWDFLTQAARPGRRIGRRHGQLHRRLGHRRRAGGADRHPHRACWPACTWPNTAATTCLAESCGFSRTCMQGIPSIVVGIVAYTLVVLPMQRFSAFAGAVALAMMLGAFRRPHDGRGDVDRLRRHPGSGHGLGQPRWRVILSVVIGCVPRSARHRAHAGHRPHRRRNRAAAVYRAQQPLLASRADAADLHADGASVHVRDRAV